MASSSPTPIGLNQNVPAVWHPTLGFTCSGSGYETVLVSFDHEADLRLPRNDPGHYCTALMASEALRILWTNPVGADDSSSAEVAYFFDP